MLQAAEFDPGLAAFLFRLPSNLRQNSKPFACGTLGRESKFMVLHFLVKGRVQGVGFRWFVHREASELALNGWVRNTEDGDVEVVVSGDDESLAELRTSLRKGPRGSRVDQVIQHELAESEGANLAAFKIEGAW
jgi:acylphosphatase